MEHDQPFPTYRNPLAIEPDMERSTHSVSEREAEADTCLERAIRDINRVNQQMEAVGYERTLKRAMAKLESILEREMRSFTVSLRTDEDASLDFLRHV